jgi:hypothetical protein
MLSCGGIEYSPKLRQRFPGGFIEMDVQTRVNTGLGMLKQMSWLSFNRNRLQARDIQ